VESGPHYLSASVGDVRGGPAGLPVSIRVVTRAAQGAVGRIQGLFVVIEGSESGVRAARGWADDAAWLRVVRRRDQRSVLNGIPG